MKQKREGDNKNIKKLQKQKSNINKMQKTNKIQKTVKNKVNKKLNIKNKKFQNNQTQNMKQQKLSQSIQSQSLSSQNSKGGQIRLLKQLEQNNSVFAVIVTFKNGQSYDELFRSVEQKSQKGTQVLVYACQASSVGRVCQALRTQSKDPMLKSMVQNIKKVDSDCVVFNWECCSNYNSNGFPQGKADVFQLMKTVIEHKHMMMFSDFSLKALIKQWDQTVLGSNPFVKTKQFSGSFTLQFDSYKLKFSPSSQLQAVGQLARDGRCNVEALLGTIVYGIDNQKIDNQKYKLQVLTVMTTQIQTQKQNQKYQCEINGKKGMAGHVLLTYKQGGKLLTSMGHWIELMKIDTTEAVLFGAIQNQFGKQAASMMKREYDRLDRDDQRKEYINRKAKKFVQSQTPCTKMKKKTKEKQLIG